MKHLLVPGVMQELPYPGAGTAVEPIVLMRKPRPGEKDGLCWEAEMLLWESQG